MSCQVMNIQQTTPVNHKKSQTSQRSSIQELKHRYESQRAMSPKTPKPVSPKKLNISKVKQLASMFNSRISHIIRRDVNVKKYTPLVNELSPEPRPVTEATLPALPVPLPRTRFTKEKAPVPSPRNSKIMQKKACSIVGEEIFSELTVKDKALLYTQFMEDMTKRNSTFISSQLGEDVDKVVSLHGEVILEKQETVKHLLVELEARCNSSNEIISPIAVQRKNSCQQLESLFFSWLRERHVQEVTKLEASKTQAQQVTQHEASKTQAQEVTQHEASKTQTQEVTQHEATKTPAQEVIQHEASNTSEMDEEKQKSAIERLLEEALAKLEIVENSQNEEMPVEVKENIINDETFNQPKTVGEGTINPNPIPAITQPLTLGLEASSESSSTSSTEPSAKNSETEESESGMCSLTKTSSDDSQPKNHTQLPGEDQLTKPLRKKKLRRSLTWRKDSSLVETYPIPSTDSETECADKGKANNKPQGLEQNPTQLECETQADESFMELDQTLISEFNSSAKIKSAYTLTAFSPVPIIEDTKKLSDFIPKPSEENELSFIGDKSKDAEPAWTLTDSFDQGFETGSNEVDSPIRPRHRPAVKRQNINKIPLRLKSSAVSPRVSTDPKFKVDTPAGFSTPIKSHPKLSFNANRSNGQQTLSPISIPLKNLRRSNQESEPRRSSLAMQVIREDQPLDTRNIKSPLSYNNTGMLYANAATLDMTNYMTALDTQKTSKFWIKTGDFFIALDIFYNDLDRVKLLYEIFSQTSCDTKDLHFGIDDHKFSVHNPEDQLNFSKRWTHKKENSHYWFSSGDLAIPFSGKLLSSEKILRIFQFIKVSVAETGVIRFGVDEVEFSNIPEFWMQPQKFSLESNCSMLVGLQSGSSNGLEGRSKYAWPHSKPTAFSNFNASEFDSDDFGENESGRLSFSPFGSNYFDLASLGAEDLMMPRNSEAMKIPESFYMDFENEPLDQLFEDEELPQRPEARPVLEVPEMINSLQQQKQCLNSVQERLSTYSRSSKLSSDALDALKGTPEYVAQLKSIVTDISRVGCNDNFKDCSVDQLERYMFFLSRYADVCLSSCGNHLDTVLDALQDQNAVAV